MLHISAVVGAALVLFLNGVECPFAQTPDALPADQFSERFHFKKSDEPVREPSKRKRPGFLKLLGVSPAQATPPSTEPLRSAVGAVPGPAPSVAEAGEVPLPRVRPAKPPAARHIARGRATYYEHPGRTASGERYDPDKLTAAHKSLPLGTHVRVVNLSNGKAVTVRINDRMPSKLKHVIDLSRGSARAIGVTKANGVATVALYRLNPSKIVARAFQ